MWLSRIVYCVIWWSAKASGRDKLICSARLCLRGISLFISMFSVSDSVFWNIHKAFVYAPFLSLLQALVIITAAVDIVEPVSAVQSNPAHRPCLTHWLPFGDIIYCNTVYTAPHLYIVYGYFCLNRVKYKPCSFTAKSPTSEIECYWTFSVFPLKV